MSDNERQFYTQFEKELLANIILNEKKHMQTVAVAQTSGGNEARKIPLAWDKIRDEFNFHNVETSPKNVKQLKGLWKSINKPDSKQKSCISHKDNVVPFLSEDEQDCRQNFHSDAKNVEQNSLKLKLKLNASRDKNPELVGTDQNLNGEANHMQKQPIQNIAGQPVGLQQEAPLPNSMGTPPQSHMKVCPAPKKCFTRAEKILFLEEMEKRVNIIESKQYDLASGRKKTATWNELTDSFNSMTSEQPRTTKQLKALWRTLKDKAKYALSYSLNVEDIGWQDLGRLPHDNILDSLLKRVCEILSLLTVNEKKSNTDVGNKFNNDDTTKTPIKQEPISEAENLDVDMVESDKSNDIENKKQFPEDNGDQPILQSDSQSTIIDPSWLSSFVSNIPAAAAYPSSSQISISPTTAVASLKNGNIDTPELNQHLLRQSVEFQKSLTEMAHIEHKERMKILQVEHEVLLLKKRKLELQLRGHGDSQPKKKAH